MPKIQAFVGIVGVVAVLPFLGSEPVAVGAELQDPPPFDQLTLERVADQHDVDQGVAEDRLVFESEFGELVDDVARQFPDQYAGSAVDKDFSRTRGCIFVNDPEAMNDRILGMARDVSGTVCVEKARLSLEDKVDLMDGVRAHVEEVVPSAIDVAVSYQVDTDELIVVMYGVGDTDFSARTASGSKKI